jgi:hypothetical protein
LTRLAGRARAAAAGAGILAAILTFVPPRAVAEEPAPGVPSREYLISVHFDLGMHCTGFDFSYCCILPPYNGILAQAVRTSRGPEDPPRVLGEADLAPDRRILWYEHEGNRYSEGPKLLYWNLPDDVNGDGDTRDPNDSFANTTWKHLFTYEERPLRFRPYPVGKLTPRYLGRDLPIPLDHGPTGKPLGPGRLDYTGPEGTVLYTVTNDGVTETPLVLAQREYWEALGLPLTPFLDADIANIREAREEKIRPYQKARVSLARWTDRNEDGIAQPAEVAILDDPRSGRPVTFFGTNPIDVPGCQKCHASGRANGKAHSLWEKELRFWRDRIPGTTEYYASIKAASISVLEIHDARHGTSFLRHYDPEATTGAQVTRLGGPPVRCQECHADNAVGRLDGLRPEADGPAIPSLSAALHRSHLAAAPDPDRNRRTASCQGCHPAHLQSGSLDEFPLDAEGRFRGGDIRDYRGGCFLGRDVHAHPGSAEILGTRSHLNAVGTWLKRTVRKGDRGLYCTNCHNLGSRLLYKADELTDALALEGRTLRRDSMEEIVDGLRALEGGRYRSYTIEDFFDPKVGPPSALEAIWSDPASDPYRVIDDGGDYWLAAGEPKCADCHLPPFVESMGGTYFPIDQREKPSLMRYSKGHHGLSCQTCHQSMHGMHPVDPDGVDPTTLAQAKLLNPDDHPGPLRCAACHTVDPDGVPVGVEESDLDRFPASRFPTRYERAVALAHTARTWEEIHGPGR